MAEKVDQDSTIGALAAPAGEARGNVAPGEEARDKVAPMEGRGGKAAPKGRRKTSIAITTKTAKEPSKTVKKTAVKRAPESPKEKEEVKKPKPDDKENEENDDFVFSETMLEEFNSTGINFTSTQIDQASDTVILNELKDMESKKAETEVVEQMEEEETMMEPDEGKEIEELKNQIEQLKQANDDKEIETVKMKSELEEKVKNLKEKEAVNVGVIQSLEQDKEVLSMRILQYRSSVPNLMKELYRLRTEVSKADGGEGKATKAEVTKLKKNLREAVEKLETVSKEKTHFEAEAKRNARVVSDLSQLLSLERQAASTEVSGSSVASSTPALSPSPANP